MPRFREEISNWVPARFRNRKLEDIPDFIRPNHDPPNGKWFEHRGQLYLSVGKKVHWVTSRAMKRYCKS